MQRVTVTNYRLAWRFFLSVYYRKLTFQRYYFRFKYLNEISSRVNLIKEFSVYRKFAEF